MALGLTGTTTGLGVTTPSFRKKMLDELNPDQKQEDPFDITNTELYKQTQQTAQDQMAGKVADFDIQANLARDAQKAAQAEAARVKRQQLMNLGLRDTGTYMQEGVINPAEQNAREAADLERQLAVERAGQVRAQQTAGQTAAQNLLGMQAGQQSQRQQQMWTTGERIGTQAWQSGESAAQRTSQEKIAFAGLSVQEKQLAQQANQFGSELEFKRYALQAGFDDAAAQRAWQASQNAAQQASQEKIAFAGLSVQEKQLAQQASQFGSELEFKRYALQAGFDEAAAGRAWQASQNAAQIASQEKIAFAGLSVQEKQLAQQAGQFGSELEFKRYALQAGFNEAAAQRAWQASQNAAQMASQEKIAFAGLDLQSKELAQQAMQFDSELAYKRYALQAGFDEASVQRAWQSAETQKQIESGERIAYLQLQQKEREMLQDLSVATSRLDFERTALDKNLDAQQQQRLWEAVQEDKRIAAQKDLATMSTDLERWKQGRVEAMTAAGWTHEDAMQAAELQARQTESDRNYYLQKYIADQNFSQREKELAQNATQFASKMDFDKWATQQGFAEQETQRVWQANQNAADRATRVQEASLDRTLQREIEAGRISQADRQLVQQAAQFKDQQSLQKWMTTQEGIRATQDRNAQYRIHSENLKAQAEELKTQIAQRKWEVTQQGISAQQDRNLQVLLQKEQQVFAAQQQTERILAESTEATAQRLWQADQNVLAQKAHASLSIAMAEMEQKGVNTRMLMSVLEALPEEQASLVISQVAKEAGLTWTDDAGVRHDGLPISERAEAGSFDEPAFTFNSADSPFREIRAGQVINGASGTNSPGNPTTPLADGQYIRLDENFRVYPTMTTSAGQQTVPAGSYQVKTIGGIMYLVSQDGKKYQMSAAPAKPASAAGPDPWPYETDASLVG